MTKEEKNAFESNGGLILRSMLNKKGSWDICYRSSKGGWKVYKSDTFENKEAADNIIDWYVRQFPSRYIKD